MPDTLAMSLNPRLKLVSFLRQNGVFQYLHFPIKTKANTIMCPLTNMQIIYCKFGNYCDDFIITKIATGIQSQQFKFAI